MAISDFEKHYFSRYASGWDDYDPSWDDMPNAGLKVLREKILGGNISGWRIVTGEEGKWYVARHKDGRQMAFTQRGDSVDVPSRVNDFRPYLRDLSVRPTSREPAIRPTRMAAAKPQFEISELMAKDLSELQALAKDKKNMDAMLAAVNAERIALAKETESALKSKFDNVTSWSEPKIGGHVMIQDLSLGGKGAYTYKIMVDTTPELRTGKYKTTATLFIGAGSDPKSLSAKTWSKRPSGKQVGDWAAKLEGSAADKVRKYWKLASNVVAGLREDMAVFSRQHPYHDDLSLIADHRRTLIGDGTFDISAGAAHRLLRAGLVDYVEGRFGTELHLTSKGRRSLAQSQEAFESL